MVLRNSAVCARQNICYPRQLVLLLAFRLTCSMKRALCDDVPQNNNINLPTLALFNVFTFHKMNSKCVNVFTVQSLESGYIHTYWSVLQLHYY